MDILDWTQVMDEHLPKNLQKKLKESTVGIAGAGGLGSNCAVLLARTGIGKLVIVDHDTVAVSNLNRQQYLSKHIGIPKVKALQQVLLAINPTLEIDIHQTYMDTHTIPVLFKNCPIVVEAVDQAITKRILAETLIPLKHTVISASGVAGWGLPMETKHLGEYLLVVGDHTHPVSQDMPPLAPRVSIAASMQADAVISTLLGVPLFQKKIHGKEPVMLESL